MNYFWNLHLNVYTHFWLEATRLDSTYLSKLSHSLKKVKLYSNTFERQAIEIVTAKKLTFLECIIHEH